MIKVAVVIPFYQIEAGILRPAILSIVTQRLSHDIHVDVIVVDDASPVSAQLEVQGIDFHAPFSLTIIRQPNGSVAAARNTGLRAVDNSTKYVAFLDSDDSWHEDHLNQAITAMESESDFYFCDHSREGHHKSHFASCTTLHNFELKLKNPKNVAMVFYLTKEEAITAILRDFVCQASTTVFRRSIAPDLFFNVEQRNAGEDMLYFLAIASRARRLCMSAKVMVHCGSGVNIYYGNLNWNAAGFLNRLVEIRRSHILIQSGFPLSRENATWNASLVAKLQKDIAFHSFRQFVRSKGTWPAELHSLAQAEPNFKRWFAVALLLVLISMPLGLYKCNRGLHWHVMSQ